MKKCLFYWTSLFKTCRLACEFAFPSLGIAPSVISNIVQKRNGFQFFYLKEILQCTMFSLFQYIFKLVLGSYSKIDKNWVFTNFHFFPKIRKISVYIFLVNDTWKSFYHSYQKKENVKHCTIYLGLSSKKPN